MSNLNDIGMRAKAEEINDAKFRNYLSPRIFDGKYAYELMPNKREACISLIMERLQDGRRIKKAGYAATSIRGFHNYYLIYED